MQCALCTFKIKCVNSESESKSKYTTNNDGSKAQNMHVYNIHNAFRVAIFLSIMNSYICRTYAGNLKPYIEPYNFNTFTRIITHRNIQCAMLVMISISSYRNLLQTGTIHKSAGIFKLLQRNWEEEEEKKREEKTGHQIIIIISLSRDFIFVLLAATNWNRTESIKKHKQILFYFDYICRYYFLLLFWIWFALCDDIGKHNGCHSGRLYMLMLMLMLIVCYYSCGICAICLRINILVQRIDK